ncbi:MAG: glutamine--fructose-6-phosphate transaminase (isomerizing) [Thermoflexales bacterium]|nr:glutamine--fructose-6-phosphate transaminase (isomerizing) [Thermoflexales bacterium]
MCGIIGYVGPRHAVPIVIGGLRRLEYRGYDSSGIAVLAAGGFKVARAVGKLSNLDPRLDALDVAGGGTHTAIGHTRWATHGGVTEQNAHPHLGRTGRIAIVHNGIVENVAALKAELRLAGIEFASETDSEVIAHLIEQGIAHGSGLEAATRAALLRLEGSQAVLAASLDEPGRLVCARIGNAGGVCIGRGRGECFVASDVAGILEHTREIVFLESHQLASVTADGLTVTLLDGAPVKPRVQILAWDPVAAEKGEHRHFMQKEILEQARSITDTLRGRVDLERGEVMLEELPLDAATLPTRLTLIGCGTSFHAALIGKFLIEDIARIPVDVDYGSEYRNRDPLIVPGSVAVAITQSGETADTLAALAEARARGSRCWAIVNAIGSQAQRMADGTITMRAGPEIGVASTKAFTASVVDLTLLACALGQAQGGAMAARAREVARALVRLPNWVGQLLGPDPVYDRLAARFHHHAHCLFLGRGINYPVALEGALKLKELSYIHAEGYPAGEMKHGPIALIDETMPVVCVAPRDRAYDKMVSQIEQIKARQGIVIAVLTAGDHALRERVDYAIEIPAAPEVLTPVLAVIPLQRLAYHLAERRGCDVDQPRNLAKSVTVE